MTLASSARAPIVGKDELASGVLGGCTDRIRIFRRGLICEMIDGIATTNGPAGATAHFELSGLTGSPLQSPSCQKLCSLLSAEAANAESSDFLFVHRKHFSSLTSAERYATVLKWSLEESLVASPKSRSERQAQRRAPSRKLTCQLSPAHAFESIGNANAYIVPMFGYAWKRRPNRV